MNREILVHVDLDGQPVFCGRLWTRSAPRESASFEYDVAWRTSRRGFCPRSRATIGGRAVSIRDVRSFRAFTDPAPDRWGQMLLRRAERARARREGRTPRTLTAVDFLTLVDDETRLGALRFRDAAANGGPFLSTGGTRVPPLMALSKLLAANHPDHCRRGNRRDLALVLAPGHLARRARPKASVKDSDGNLLVAQFPTASDEWPATALGGDDAGTGKAGRDSCTGLPSGARGAKACAAVARFDRDGEARVPFHVSDDRAVGGRTTRCTAISISSMLCAGRARQAAKDLGELWRRLVFNVLVSNTDDSSAKPRLPPRRNRLAAGAGL